MKKISTTKLISFGLTMLMVALLLTAHFLGLIPDNNKAVANARAKECETLAVQCAVAAGRNDMGMASASLSLIVALDPEISSAGFRLSDGKLIYQVGPHLQQWQDSKDESSTFTQVQVPIFKGKERWGAVEISFMPIGGVGWTRHFKQPVILLLSFISTAGFVCFYFYLRRVLKHLDPSAVIPQRVKAILDSLAEGVLVMDNQALVVVANEAFSQITGRTLTDLQGKSLSLTDWADPTTNAPAAKLPWKETIRTKDSLKAQPLAYLGGTGGKRLFMVTTTPVIGIDGKMRGVLATFDDVTAVEQMNLELQQSRAEIEKRNRDLEVLASRDMLTGLFNRRALFEQFREYWQKASSNHQRLACIMLDIDHFKSINDLFGHPVGDKVLKEVAEILLTCARKQDIVGRYGGEEFCVVMPGATLIEAEAAAESIRKSIESKKWSHRAITASFGVSSIEMGATQVEGILDQADKALYVAKERGRNRVVRIDMVRDDKKPNVATPERRVESQINPQIVDALVSSLSHRDKNTAEHCRRVAALCVAVGNNLMPAWDCRVLGFGALLHDIGKLGIPDRVLLKPGPLTAEEWTVMRTHERHGIEIVSAAFDHKSLTEIVGLHHAWYGGTTDSPELPKGEKIPLAARILAIADAFDAMVYERPYRKGRPPEDALFELRRCANIQFDPQLVERFIEFVLSSEQSRSTSKADKIAQEIAEISSTVVDQHAAALKEITVHASWMKNDVSKIITPQKPVEALTSKKDNIAEPERPENSGLGVAIESCRPRTMPRT